MSAVAVPTVAQIRVETGVELLDRTHPDWWKRIDLETLDLEDSRLCILGQLFGSYNIGVDEVIPGWGYDSVEERAEHGFTLKSSEMDWDTLLDAWRDLIRERREEAFV